MFIEEARWLAEKTREASSPALNVGSSTRRFRTIDQPHIHELVFLPLEARNVDVVHLDIKVAEGVDLAGDLLDDTFWSLVRDRRFQTIICSNLLEHVVSPRSLATRISQLLAPGALLFVTVPHLFPPHGDPIDTMFRPSPQQVATFFPRLEVVEYASIVADDSFARMLARNPSLLAKVLARLAVPVYKPRSWLDLVRYAPRTFRRFEVSAAVLRRPE